MNKKVLASLILAVLVSLLVTIVVSDYFAKKEFSLQKSEDVAGRAGLAESIVSVGVPFSYGCRGLCAEGSIDIKNLLKDVAVFYIPSYIFVYFLLEAITRRRVRFVSQ